MATPENFNMEQSARSDSVRLRPRMRDRLQQRVFLIPSFITVAAFFSGLLGAFIALRGDYEYAIKCIALAILFDGLDGRVARKLKATTAFGREFDSLSDLVAFGVAPAMLVYWWAFRTAIDDFGILVAFVYVVCGAARLARFNISTSSEPKRNFDGLPIPGAAAALLALVYWSPAEVLNPVAVTGVVVYMTLVSALMVSTIPFFSVKHIKLTQKNIRLNIVLLSAVVALVWYHNRFSILLITLAYVLSGPFMLLLGRKAKAAVTASPPQGDPLPEQPLQ